MRKQRLILSFTLTVMLTVALTGLVSAQTDRTIQEKNPSASQTQTTDESSPHITHLGNANKPQKDAENTDLDTLLDCVRANLATDSIADALAASTEALRLYPDSPSALAVHMAALHEAGKDEALLNTVIHALPLAIEKQDAESATKMLNSLRVVLQQAHGHKRTSLSERLTLVKPLELANQTLRRFPNLPPTVLAYFSLFKTIRSGYYDYHSSLNMASSDVQEADFWAYVIPSIETAKRDKQWETLCGLLKLYCRRVRWDAENTQLPEGSTDEVLLKMGLPLPSSTPDDVKERFREKEYEKFKTQLAEDQACLIQRWKNDNPKRFPTWMAEAAIQLKDKDHLTTAYYMMNTVCKYPRDANHFMNLSASMDRYRKLALDAGIEHPGDAEARYLCEFAFNWAAGIGDDTDLDFVKTCLPNQYRQYIMPTVAYAWRDLEAERRQSTNYKPKSKPKPTKKQSSSSHKYFMPPYEHALKDLQRVMQRVTDSPDDATTAQTLRRLRGVVDEAITAGILEDRFPTVLEHAECFHGWAMRNLLATRRPSAPQPTAESSTERPVTKQPRPDLHARADREDVHSGTDPESNQMRDLATEAHIMTGPSTWLTTTQGEMQKTRPVAALQADEIQRMLDKDTAFLYCHLTTFVRFPHRIGFVALVTNDNLKLHSSHTLNLDSGRMPIGANGDIKGWQRFKGFHDRCMGLQESLHALRERPPSEGLDKTLKKSLRDMYDALIAPIEEDLPAKHLVIVPSDDLFSIPWGLLLDKNGRYLCEKVAISYVPSATVLQFCRIKHAPLGNRALVFANPDLADPNYALKFAEQEANLIKGCYPSTKAYLGTSATETTLLKDLAKADIIHLACHAIHNRLDPMASYLALAQDEANDGRLSASEIMNLQTTAQMVVLSACESGRGDVPEGQQEIVGMIRAWMFAGSPSVVASLWKVDDRATSELMAEFYKNLNSMSRSESLQRAQLTMMEQYDNPYYWGAFVLYGDYR